MTDQDQRGRRARVARAVTCFALTGATALACGSTKEDSASSIQSFDEWLVELAASTCRRDCDDFMAAYVEHAYGADETECVEIVTLADESVLSSQKASIDAGRISFDAAKAQRCIDLRAAGKCDEWELACDGVLVGHVPVGESCTSSDECAGSAYCEDLLACPGTCVAHKGLGDACSGSSLNECAPGLSCSYDTGACSEQKADGAYFGMKLGEPCDVDVECEPGLYCQSGSCAQTAALREACSEDAACGSAAYCLLESDTDSGVCVEGIPVGGSCDDSDQCKTGACEGGTCQKHSGLGEPCVASDRCVAASCEDGVCAPLFDCALL